ncbi:MAG: tripartite tricarboxylate transporter TctB family protein, partial [Deltaproteobacteria bacterium]|nr:tripartite tricarboxylate transporter TctB family protein [Deltaproteobacteria bacterium]
MTSPIRSIKDFLTGLIYITIGSGAIIIALVGDYHIGTALKMGPAYFPLFLSMLLVLVGIISLVRSFITPGTPIGSFAVKGLLLVVASTVLFGLVVRGASPPK